MHYGVGNVGDPKGHHTPSCSLKVYYYQESKEP